MRKKFKVLKKKKEIINSYDRTADFYDKRYRLIQKEKYHIVLKNCKIKGKKILDIGCGTGLLVEYILQLRGYREIRRSKYIAVDISSNMLLKFQNKLLKLKSKPNVQFVLSDIDNLPFRNESFDVILSLTSFQNLPSILNGIRESIRVGANNCVFKFSILRKTIALEQVKNFLLPLVKDIELINKHDIEDVIIQGIVKKKST